MGTEHGISGIGYFLPEINGYKVNHPSKRARKMARLAERMAESPLYGYSQKPPSGRWGPDFDCASFIYEIADAVGYPVGTGSDKVRYTGVMLEDFKDAGFQLLPFANVGLGELEVGDILLNLALHAEIYVGEGQVVGAQGSETGGFVGEAGDQTGDEIKKQPAYIYEKGWDYVLRPPSEDKELELGYTEEGEPEIEGDEDMAYPYTNWMPPQTMTTPYGMNGRNYMQQQNYGNGMGGGYPQGNLGQMNGYSMANGGNGYPNQGGMPGWPQGQQGSRQIMQVRDLNEMRDVHVGPGEAVAAIIGDGKHMAVKMADQEGYPSIRVYEECSENMPQHGGGWDMNAYTGQQQPQMQQSQGVSRQEFDQLKEMINNVQSAISAAGYPQGNQPNGNRADDGRQSANGGRSNTNGSSGQSSGRNSRNS